MIKFRDLKICMPIFYPYFYHSYVAQNIKYLDMIFLHVCVIHHWPHPDFFSHFSETRNFFFQFFVNARITGARKHEFSTPYRRPTMLLITCVLGYP